jgi:hypothetical protein
MRCGRTEGGGRVHVATNFYTPKLLTFQPAVSAEAIRSAWGSGLAAAGAISTHHSALSCRVRWHFSKGGVNLHGIG